MTPMPTPSEPRFRVGQRVSNSRDSVGDYLGTVSEVIPPSESVRFTTYIVMLDGFGSGDRFFESELESEKPDA